MKHEVSDRKRARRDCEAMAVPLSRIWNISSGEGAFGSLKDPCEAVDIMFSTILLSV